MTMFDEKSPPARRHRRRKNLRRQADVVEYFDDQQTKSLKEITVYEEHFIEETVYKDEELDRLDQIQAYVDESCSATVPPRVPSLVFVMFGVSALAFVLNQLGFNKAEIVRVVSWLLDPF